MAGFLGAEYEPFAIRRADQATRTLEPPMGLGEVRRRRRYEPIDRLDARFNARHPVPAAVSLTTLRQSAARLTESSLAEAFDFGKESAETLARHGQGRFGEGCLLARRLLDVGTPFVEVTLSGWDTHDDTFGRSAKLVGRGGCRGVGVAR